MLNCENEEKYASKFAEHSDRWSQPFVDYYKRFLEKDLCEHAARWLLIDLGLYYPHNGITNNIAESMNAVIKRLMEWREVAIDHSVIAFKFLQQYYVKEMMRGLAGHGIYHIKGKYGHAKIDVTDIPELFTYHPDEIVHQIQLEKIMMTHQKPLSSWMIAKLQTLQILNFRTIMVTA